MNTAHFDLNEILFIWENSLNIDIFEHWIRWKMIDKLMWQNWIEIGWKISDKWTTKMDRKNWWKIERKNEESRRNVTTSSDDHEQEM